MASAFPTLKTSGTAFLLRGDLALRKVTVLRENVERERRVSVAVARQSSDCLQEEGGWELVALAVLRLGPRHLERSADRGGSPVDRRSDRMAGRQSRALRRASLEAIGDARCLGGAARREWPRARLPA